MNNVTSSTAAKQKTKEYWSMHMKQWEESKLSRGEPICTEVCVLNITRLFTGADCYAQKRHKRRRSNLFQYNYQRTKYHHQTFRGRYKSSY